MTYNSYIHVTQALSPYTDFSGIPDYILKRAALRGTKVHAACVAYAMGVWVVPPDKSVLGMRPRELICKFKIQFGIKFAVREGNGLHNWESSQPKASHGGNLPHNYKR